jgi:hypothetical protein
VAQQAGDQRRQGKKVQNVVAKIGEQGRLFFAHADQIAQWIGETFDDCRAARRRPRSADGSSVAGESLVGV